MKILLSLVPFLLFAGIGKFTLIEGDVTLDQKKASLKSEILKKAVIQTAKNARAKVRFNDNTLITIGENSRFKVEEFINDTKPKANFRFFSGKFKAVTGKIGKVAPQRFKLKTNTMIIGIRGTVVVFDLNNKREIVGVEKGSVGVTSLLDGRSVILNAGERVKNGIHGLGKKEKMGDASQKGSQKEEKDSEEDNQDPGSSDNQKETIVQGITDVKESLKESIIQELQIDDFVIEDFDSEHK